MAYLKKSFTYSRAESQQKALKKVAQLLLNIAVLWLGAILVMDGKMSLGQLITYNTLLVYFTNPLENIINLQTKLQTAQVANNRLNEVYLVASEFEEKKTVEDLSMMKGDMTFKQVHYKYGYGRDVLSDINLTIPQGSKVAFVGISGSGKTTLAKERLVWVVSISIRLIKKLCASLSTICLNSPMSLMGRFWRIFSLEPRRGRLRKISYEQSSWPRFGRILSACH